MKGVLHEAVLWNYTEFYAGLLLPPAQLQQINIFHLNT
jgi:hypothetical protein